MLFIGVILSMLNTCVNRTDETGKQHQLIDVNSPNSEGINAQIELKVNSIIELEIPSNPSTGYSWAWNNESSVEVVDTIEKTFKRNPEPLVGAGGKEFWTFKGLQSGIDTVELIYRQEWAPDVNPLEVKIIFNIKE